MLKKALAVGALCFVSLQGWVWWDDSFHSNTFRSQHCVPPPSAFTMSKTAILIGGTGQVGKHLTRELVESGAFSKVRSLVRSKREPEYYGLKEEGCLEQVVIPDFHSMDVTHFEGFEYGFSAFGTTRKIAGSAEAFEKIDYGINVAAGELMKKGGVKHMQLVSSQGANAKGFLLYPSVKGRIEETLKACDFEKLTIWRPGLLAGREDSSRGGESFLNCIVPNHFRVHVRTVARALMYNALKPLHESKVETYENGPLKKAVEAAGGKEAMFEQKY